MFCKCYIYIKKDLRCFTMNVKSSNRGVKVDKSFLGMIKITRNAVQEKYRTFRSWLCYASKLTPLKNGYGFKSNASLLTLGYSRQNLKLAGVY